MVKRGDMMDIDDMIDILAIDLLGVVPDDEAIVISANRGEPVVANQTALAGQAFKNITRRIIGENVPFINMENEESFMSRLRKIFGLAK